MTTQATQTGTLSERKTFIQSMKSPDEFYKVVHAVFSKMAEKKSAVYIALAALLAVGLALSFWSNQRQAQVTEAKNALFDVMKALDKDSAALAPKAPEAPKAEAGKAPAQPNPADAIEFAKLDVDAKFGATIEKVKTLDQKFPSTRAAYEARLLLGKLYFDHQDAAKAMPWLQKAVESAPNKLEKTMALATLGYAQERAGDMKAAAETFEKAYQQGEAAVRGDVMLSQGRVALALNDKAKARSIYDQVILQFPNTDLAKIAEQQRAQAGL